MKKKKILAMLMALTLTIQQASVISFAEETSNNDTDKNSISETYWSDLWTGQTTDEILERIEKNNLDLTKFFDADLTKGITKDDLVKWKNEGKDINDVILERGRQYSSRINDNSNTESTWTDENGITHVNVKTHNSAITSDPNNFYYITDCETPKSFSNAIVDSPNKFRNPKIDISKVKYPVKLNSWDITLGYDEAVCLSFNGGARRNNGMHFVQGNITDLLNNISFNKNNTSNYPIDSYLRGAIYAYERLMNIKYGNTPYSFVHSDGTPATNLYYILDGKNVYDSNLNELEKTLQNLRGINGEDVIKSYDRDAYRMMLQILVWRISQGDYQNWDLQTEMDIAANIFGQMTGYNEQVLKDITNIYNYFLHCAGEAATNQYNNLYTSIAIQYYAVQGTNSENYQDFVTWDVVKPNVPSCTITINKIGNEIKTSVADNSGLKLPFAQFGIYSNKDCTNKIASFTTDFNGQATLNLVEGTYYLKEENAPKGAIINNNIIPITILDNTGNTYNSYINNNLFYNKLIMVKYDNKTKEIIKNPGVFLLQEKVGNNYMTVAQLSFTDVDMNIGNTKIPAYSYYLSPYANQIYHDGNGNIMSNIQHDGFYYTTVNDGNFRVIEQSAPSGYENTSATLTISMDLTNQGKVLLYNKFSTGMKDNPKNYTSTLNVKKYDTMSGEELKNVAFKLQERVNNTWYDCGNLIYNDTIGYFTTNIATTYVFHKDNGTTYTTSQSNYPILSTKYNSGSFRIVETKLENEHYKITAIKTFSVPQKDNYVADMTVYNSHNNNSGINNTGENLTVYVNKYDSITKEPITENQQTITLELFEYNKTKKDYLSIGTLSYDEKLNRYSLNSTTLYTPHTLNGELNTTLSIGENIIPGNIYYTSANEGKFKIVETIAPKNYILGNIKDDGTVEKFEKEFNIENTTSIDFTSIDTGVIDTPVNIKANVSKYDTTTNEKINTTNAEFTVYEKIGEQYYESGKLVYNKDTKQYETKGMTLRLCNSKGVVVFEKKVDGLYYTSANKGFYKIVETKAPTNYELNEFSKEFNIINDSVNNIIDFTNTLSAAKDTGIKGSVEVKKFDINTNDIVTTNDAEFTVYEKIDTDYIEIGKLNFDKNTKSYVSSGDYTYHNLDKKAVNTVNGLIYTNENKGEFKIVETKAPTNYKLNKYEKTFNITKTKNVKYTDLTNGAKDTGIKGSVKLLKTDKNTNKVLTGATFELKEWSTVTNSWKTIDTLTDNKDGIYTTNKLVYTTSNLGKFIVTEIKAPDGYINENYTSEVLILDTDEKMFDLTSNEKKVTNTPIQVGISKKSLTNNKDIKNAELIVKDNNGTQIDKWISDGTEHIISGIKPGTYTLTEISSPNGYLISRTITFIVKETTEIQKVIMYDDIVRGKVHLTKADKNTNKKLSDAIYELRDSKDNLIDTLTTDKNGNADSKEISFGIYDTDGTYKGSKEYYLTEVKAPEGYQLDNSKIPVTFDYKDDTTPIVITNINVKDLPLIPLNIEISKKSLTTTKDLVGATLEVISENGTVIDKWISNGKTHTIRNVKAGKYILIEITAPNGYIRTSKVEFTVDGEHEITKVEMFDDIVKGKLILNKIDSDTQKKLADATFELLDSNGKVIDTLVTNNEGYAESKEIYFGNYAENGEYLGSKEYTLVEKKAPNGYNLKNDKEKITFDYVNDTTPIVIKNALEENVPIKVSISKKSFTTEKDIIGAELIVTDNNGNEVDKWVSDGTEHIRNKTWYLYFNRKSYSKWIY